MRGPKPPVVELSPEEQQGLETLVRRYSTPQQLARRGRIILSAAAGLNNSQIAREVGLDVDTVRFWRNRWLGLQAAILEDLSIGNCSELRGSEQPAAFQEGIETSGPPGAKEGCQGHLAVGALP